MKKDDIKRDLSPQGNKITMTAMHDNRFSSAVAPAAPSGAKAEEKTE